MNDVNKYKMGVISGVEEEDGLIRFFGESDEYMYHLECLKDYLYTYYNDFAKQIGADDLRNNEEIIIYLNTMGNIVYLHSPEYELLFIPKEVTEKQIESLYEVARAFPKTPIYIDYHLVRKHGKILPMEIIDYSDDMENTEVLDRFFETKPYIKRKEKSR